MSCRVLCLSLLALSLASCSSVNHKQANGGFDYQNKPQARQIVIPDNLIKPKQSQDFFVTDKINHQGPIGEAMDIRGPSLVMPVAASSRVVDESGIAIIWFDKVLEDKELIGFIEKVVIDQLNEDGVSHEYIEEDLEVHTPFKALLVTNRRHFVSKFAFFVTVLDQRHLHWLGGRRWLWRRFPLLFPASTKTT